ncbi:MAG: MATE family efflux transporter [Coriobacteriia bacterium]|nr:MATE family efflux transporter [Coriobacteriia bacterium]
MFAKKEKDKKKLATDPERLGNAPIGKLLIEFSIPAIIMMVFNTLYNIVDTIFLGYAVPVVGVAVTTLAFPIMTVLMGFSMLAGQGGSALAAIQMGQGDRNKVEWTLGNTAMLLFGMSLVVALVALVAIDPLLAVIGATKDPSLTEPTRQFVQIICVGFAFQSLGMGLNNFLRTAGKPNLSLATGVFGTIMCIVFNYVFVIMMGMGVPGSALATVVGQLFGAVPVLWYFILSKDTPFRLRVRCLKPQLKLCRKIMALGVASFAMQVAGTLVGIVFNQVINVYGPTDPIGIAGALSSIGVAQKVCMFCFTPLIGLTMGAQPIFGFNYGAKNWQRVLTCFKLTCLTAVAIGAVFLLCAYVIPYPMVGLFGVTGQYQEFSVWALQVMCILFPPVGYQIVGSNYFQASGQPMKATILELTRQVIFLTPLYVILPPLLHDMFGLPYLHSVVFAAPVSDALSICVTTVFVVYEIRKLRRLRDEQRNGGAPQPPAGAPAPQDAAAS